MNFVLNKVKTARKNLENRKVLLMDPVGSIEGPMMLIDPTYYLSAP